MDQELLDQEHTLGIDKSGVVLRSMNDMALRSLILDAFNKKRAEEICLFIGDKHVWDLEIDEVIDKGFDGELLSLMNEAHLAFDSNGELKGHVRLVAVVDAPQHVAR